MNKLNKPIVADSLLLLVTAIWGSTFVVVKEAVVAFPPNTFVAIRFAIAALALAVMGDVKKWFNPHILKAGLVAGLFLAGGYIFQTWGLLYTTPAKAGFITGLSVVMVPMFDAILRRRRPSAAVICGAALAAAGLALLSLGPSVSLNIGDILVLICSVCFAAQIIAIGKYASKMDALALTGVQLLVVALVAACFAAFEPMPTTLPRATLWGLLLTAIPATSLAFLIQSRMQRFTTASHTALIFSAEPVFAAIFSYLLIGEVLGIRGLVGSGLIFGGIIIAEVLPLIQREGRAGKA